MQLLLVHLVYVDFIVFKGCCQQCKDSICLLRILLSSCRTLAFLPKKLQLDLMEPLWEERFKKIGHQVGLVRLIALDELLETVQNLQFYLIWVQLVDFDNDIAAQALHHLLLERLASDHQVPQAIETLYTEAVASDDRQLRQDGQEYAA